MRLYRIKREVFVVKEKGPELSLLFDFYGALLTEKQRDIFAMYYDEDLSLGEIAENEGITRQGVRDALVRAENTLRDTERKLGLRERYGRMESVLDALEADARELRAINRDKYLSGEIDDKIRDILGRVRDLREDI